MRPAGDPRRMRCAALVAGLALSTALAGCGQQDFTRTPPRPPATIQITGVITPQEVEVSPNRIGAGPIILIVSNQASTSHTVILEGERLRERVGPINPQDTATIQANLQQGRYTVRAGSERAVSPSQAIKPDVLSVGRERPTGEDELLRP
jgi:poly(3-hydroxybutyrate) depolymerase